MYVVMKIILLSRWYQAGRRAFSTPGLGLFLGVMFAAFISGSLWLGYEEGLRAAADKRDEPALTAMLEEQLGKQRRELELNHKRMRSHLDALALRMGKLQSHILRLDALGERLTEVGDLDPEEFTFSETPARGGLETPDGSSSIELSELLSDMEQLTRTIEDREYKLNLMEDLLLSNRVLDELKPAGRPVKKGWISSRYGYRKDPFSGKKTFHHGVDIAGKKGSEVFAVASGIVTVAGKKGGYGYLVEIRHVDGLVTRYGHNSKIFVEVGDLVSKGDRVGAMGSTGRSTGPHVHFEVARNSKSVNPAKFLKKR